MGTRFHSVFCLSFQSDPQSRIHLDGGDLILLATDGFFEWENDRGEDFGVQRMENVIRASRDLAPAEIIARLYKAVIQFSNGTRQQDDLTAVLIKYKSNGDGLVPSSV